MPTTNSPKSDVIPVRFTRQQRQQISELVDAGFGPQADVIRTAIDRMYQQERGTMHNQARIEFLQRKIEGWTVRMDSVARMSSADPVIQKRLDAEVDGLFADIREAEAEIAEISKTMREAQEEMKRRHAATA